MTDRPNVVLLTIDTLRRDVLGCYGAGPSQTPHIDRLASSSIRFDQAITGGSWTQAAFPVMLTSTYASMYGGCLGSLAPQRPSPIEALAAQGYATAAFSTNPHLSRRSAYDRGFHHFTDLVPEETDPRLRSLKGGQHLLRSSLFHYLTRPVGRRLRPARLYSSAADLTDSACHWLRDAKAPFFAWVHYMDLHWPYHLEEALDHPRDIARAWQDLGIMNGRSNFDHASAITAAQRDHFVALYTRSLRYLDAQIGRLVNCLESLGHDSNTIIILVSDHGEEFLDHGRWGHWESNLFDEILRVPLLIRLPGNRTGKVIARQVRLLDLMPTVLDLCACPSPDGVLGTSLRPLWMDCEYQYDVEIAISEMPRAPWHRVSVRTEEFKFVWDSKRPDQPELYDLISDPHETESVAEQYSQDVARFQEQVKVHLRKVAQTQPEAVAPQPELDKEIARRLRGLGYIE